MIADKHNRELVIKAKAGDETAMDKLIDKNKRLVYKINHKFGNTEDGIQEGILAFYDAVRTFDLSYSTKFTTHLYAWIENRIRQYREKLLYGTTRHYIKKCKSGELEYKKEELPNEITGSEEDNYLKIEQLSILKPLLKKLTQQEQTVIQKLYFEGYTQFEIANQMKLRKQRISFIHQTALAKLRSKLCQQAKLK